MRPGPWEEKGKGLKMDFSMWMMVGLFLVLLVLVYLKTGRAPFPELVQGGKLLWSILPRLLIGFAIAGLVLAILPESEIARWLGAESGLRGIGIAWLVGSLLPTGGPYVTFPIMAGLMRSGAGMGPMITFLAAKSLLGPIRVLAWELPLLGGEFMVSRVLASLFVPPLIGIVGQFVFGRLFHS